MVSAAIMTWFPSATVRAGPQLQDAEPIGPCSSDPVVRAAPSEHRADRSTDARTARHQPYTMPILTGWHLPRLRSGILPSHYRREARLALCFGQTVHDDTGRLSWGTDRICSSWRSESN